MSQLIGLQEKMREVEEGTCYPWQLNWEWTPRVKASEKMNGGGLEI